MKDQAVIFDFMRTIYNPETGTLNPFAKNLLEHAYTSYDCFLVSKNGEGRNTLVAELGIENFFKSVHYVDTKTTDLFTEIIGNNYTEVYVIGDRISSEIATGNKLGYTTVWFKNGKFAEEGPTEESGDPDHIVLTLEEVRDII